MATEDRRFKRPPPAPATLPSITDGGLHIWSYPDDGGERFVLMVLVGSGARQETSGKTGLAHLLEHVLLGG